VFFLVYAATGFTVRVVSRRLTEDFGFGTIICVGMGLLALGTLGFMLLEIPGEPGWGGYEQYLLIVPALISGVAHALIFPAIVASGSSSFPDRYRGLATTLILASFDFGGLIGPPIVGAIIVSAGAVQMQGYPLMLICVAGMLASSIVVFVLCGGLHAREVE